MMAYPPPEANELERLRWFRDYMRGYATFLDESSPRFTHGADAVMEETAKTIRSKIKWTKPHLEGAR